MVTNQKKPRETTINIPMSVYITYIYTHKHPYMHDTNKQIYNGLLVIFKFSILIQKT